MTLFLVAECRDVHVRCFAVSCPTPSLQQRDAPVPLASLSPQVADALVPASAIRTVQLSTNEIGTSGALAVARSLQDKEELQVQEVYFAFFVLLARLFRPFCFVFG